MPRGVRDPQARGEPCLAPLWAVAVAAGTLVAITNRWVGNVGIHPWGGDVTSYERIASAAPGLPSARLGSAYTGRFAVHFVTGLLSDVLGIGLHAAYRVVALL